MASIQLSGLSTGIDTAAIIERLMAVERRRLTILQSNISSYKTKQDAVSKLDTKLSAFRSALNALSDSSQLRSYESKTSNSDLLTATANNNAYEGTHNIKIKQMATANRWVHNGFDYMSQFVGAGNLILSYQNREFIVQTTDDTTLQDLVELINNDPDNPGITASILEYNSAGGRFHLVLSGRESGSDFQISINASNTEVHTSSVMQNADGQNAALTTRLSNLQGASGFGTGATPDRIRIQGTLHDSSPVDQSFQINPYTTVEELMNQIESAFGGTIKATLDEGALVVTDRTSGSSALTISLSLESGDESSAVWTPPIFTETTAGGSISSGLALLDSSTFMETQAAQDSMIKIDGYPPGDDTDPNTWIRRSSNSISDVIAGVTLNLHGATGNDADGYNSVEVTLNRNTVNLKDKMQAMVDAYNAVIKLIDEKTAYNKEEKKSGVLSSEYSLSSIKSLIRTPLLFNTAGFSSRDSFVKPEDIGLKIKADGTLTLDANAFDEAISEDYMGLLSLIGAKKTGGTNSSIIKFYQASSYTEAGQYEVRVSIEEGVVTAAQIKLKDEDWSAARDMTISGGTLYGSSETGAKGYPAHPEYSMVLSVDTTQNGAFEAAVHVKQGFAGNLQKIVDDMLKPGTGRVSLAATAIQGRIDNVNKRVSDEEDRLKRVEERLHAQYARLESLIQSIQQQMSGLSML